MNFHFILIDKVTPTGKRRTFILGQYGYTFIAGFVFANSSDWRHSPCVPHEECEKTTSTLRATTVRTTVAPDTTTASTTTKGNNRLISEESEKIWGIGGKRRSGKKSQKCGKCRRAFSYVSHLFFIPLRTHLNAAWKVPNRNKKNQLFCCDRNHDDLVDEALFCLKTRSHT